MNTHDFIRRHYALINDGNESGYATHATVIRDGSAFYSYGYHYPLLIRITTPDGRNLWVRNTAGYSNTTSKHIAHCDGLQDIDAKMPRSYRYVSGSTDAEHVVLALQKELADIDATMATKKRTDTAVFMRLLNDRARVTYALRVIQLHGNDDGMQRVGEMLAQVSRKLADMSADAITK